MPQMPVWLFALLLNLSVWCAAIGLTIVIIHIRRKK